MAKDKSSKDSSTATRPKYPDRQQLEDLGFAQCSLDDAAIIMDRAGRSIPFNQAELKAHEKGRVRGLNELREAQLGMAKKSAAMATMLGRRYLDQTGQREHNESGPIDYAGIKERHRDKVRDILAAGKEGAD
jgi:hypothetical protein